jgi:hypothetical protein
VEKRLPALLPWDWWIIFILEAHRMNDVEDSVAFCVLFPVLVVVHSVEKLKTPRLSALGAGQGLWLGPKELPSGAP